MISTTWHPYPKCYELRCSRVSRLRASTIGVAACMAKTGESEKLIGIEGDKALVTLVTFEARTLRRIASYRGKRDNDVSRERSE
jgi:hypothetical protein